MYERPSLRALGFFVLHIGGVRYGVYEDDATMLANSFDEVGRRITNQGGHRCPFALADAGRIADAVSEALYEDGPDDDALLGISRMEISESVSSSHLLWTTDGDEAFDDGSYVLQFDVDQNVCLIAFQRPVGLLHEPSTLRDVWITAEQYYLTKVPTWPLSNGMRPMAKALTI